MGRVAVALIACLALASCGGDDGGSDKGETGETAVQATAPSPSPSPSDGGGGSARPSGAKARYIARADAICRSANARLRPIRAKLAKVDDGSRTKGEVFGRFEELTGRAATITDGVIGRFEDVRPPAPDRAAIERIQALLEQQSRVLHGLAAAAGRQDVREIKRLNEQITGLNETYRSQTRAYGFKVCGQVR